MACLSDSDNFEAKSLHICIGLDVKRADHFQRELSCQDLLPIQHLVCPPVVCAHPENFSMSGILWHRFRFNLDARVCQVTRAKYRDKITVR